MAAVAGGGDGNICRNATENAILISSSPHLGSLLYGMPANSADTVEQDLEPDVLDGLLMLGTSEGAAAMMGGKPSLRYPLRSESTETALHSSVDPESG